MTEQGGCLKQSEVSQDWRLRPNIHLHPVVKLTNIIITIITLLNAIVSIYPAKIMFLLVWFVRCCQAGVRIVSELHPYYRKLCENWKLANIGVSGLQAGTPAGKWSLKTYHISSEHDANMMDAHETSHTKHISPPRYLLLSQTNNNADLEHWSIRVNVCEVSLMSDALSDSPLHHVCRVCLAPLQS